MSFFPSTFPEPVRIADFFRGFIRRFGLNVAALLRTAQISWSRMMLWRLLQGKREWRPDLVEPLIPVVVQETGCPPALIWQHFLDAPAHPLLSELESCQFWRFSTSDLAALTAMTTKAIAHPASWTYTGRVFAPWLMPIEPRLRCTRSVSDAVAPGDKTALDGLRSLFHRLHREVMPASEVLPIHGMVLTLQSHFSNSVLRTWPMDRFHPEHIADFVSSLAYDVVKERGTIVGFIDDVADAGTKRVADQVKHFDSLLVIDDRFMLKRDAGSSVWATCERTGDPARDRFLDDQIQFLNRLKQKVHHPLNPRSSFELIIRHLFPPDERRSSGDDDSSS